MDAFQLPTAGQTDPSTHTSAKRHDKDCEHQRGYRFQRANSDVELKCIP